MAIVLKKCAGPGCVVETSQPLAGEYDWEAKQVVHFHSMRCRALWLEAHPPRQCDDTYSIRHHRQQGAIMFNRLIAVAVLALMVLGVAAIIEGVANLTHAPVIDDVTPLMFDEKGNVRGDSLLDFKNKKTANAEQSDEEQAFMMMLLLLLMQQGVIVIEVPDQPEAQPPPAVEDGPSESKTIGI